MSVYFPDLLTEFIDAIDERRELVIAVESEAKHEAKNRKSIEHVSDEELKTSAVNLRARTKGLTTY